MINPIEIRIGNFVEYNSEIYEVEGVLSDCCCLKGFGMVDWDSISPVKLTMKILKKLGLDKTQTFNIETYIPCMIKISAIAELKGTERVVLIFDLFNDLAYGNFNEFIRNNKQEILSHVNYPNAKQWLAKHEIIIDFLHQLQNIDYALFKTVTTIK